MYSASLATNGRPGPVCGNSGGTNATFNLQCAKKTKRLGQGGEGGYPSFPGILDLVSRILVLVSRIQVLVSRTQVLVSRIQVLVSRMLVLVSRIQVLVSRILALVSRTRAGGGGAGGRAGGTSQSKPSNVQLTGPSNFHCKVIRKLNFRM